jgi:hypothetical protein
VNLDDRGDLRAAIVRSNPPRCLRAFSSGTAAVTADEHWVEVSFPVACAACSNDRFELSEVSVTWTAEGRTSVTAVGLSAQCAGCGADETLFDQSRHGYDGALGHLRFLRGPRSSEPLRRADGVLLGRSCVRVSFMFNLGFEELNAIRLERGAPLQDLFDWFSVWAQSAAGDWEAVWECECA